MVKRDGQVAAALAIATFALLLATEHAIGFVRDEGFYFRAGDEYAAWVLLLFQHPSAALHLSSIDRFFAYNAEHPALLKLLSGLSHALFTTRLGICDHGCGFRLPAMALSGFLSAGIYLLGARTVGRAAALFAVAAFWLTPRSFFHGHLAGFDMPVTALWVWTTYGWLRALDGERRWQVGTGLLFGLTLATKLNGFFLPILLAMHLLVDRRPGGVRALVWMAVLGPLVFFLSWPWLWGAPVARLLFYVRFHLTHVNYPWEYLGDDLRAPPFPLAYVAVLTALTVPVTILLLQAAGLVRGIARFREPGMSLLVLASLFSLAVITNPWAPHFGGVKHWLPAMPYLCLLAGDALVRASRAAAERLARIGAPRPQALAGAVLAVAALAPAAMATARSHPFGTVFYNELAGGGPGGAALGMQRQFWSNDVSAVLPWLDAHAPLGARVYLHEVVPEAILAYKLDGLLRKDLIPAASPEDADLVAYQHMNEFRDIEFRTWNALGTRQAAAMFDWDAAPQVTVYARKGLALQP